MMTAYVVLTSLTAAGTALGAWMNFARHPIPVAAAAQVQVSESWMRPLGMVMLAGGLGLVAGFVIPPLGIAAASGLVLYFVGAVIAHLRVGDLALGRPVAALVLTAATLAVTLAFRLPL